MKMVCSKQALVNGVNIVSKAIPARTSMSILECILIFASNDSIKLIANDMELGIETTIDGDVNDPGTIALDAKIFGDIVKRLPDGPITIESDENLKAKITCLKAKFNLPGRSGDDFSYLPNIERYDYITISQYTLKEIIRQTVFSISENENNKLMTGELFEINDDKLRVASLDGHRISIRNIELRHKYEPRKVVVPGKTLIEISKILSGEVEKEVNIFFMENYVIFEFDRTVVVSRVIEGEYFDIDQMMSGDTDIKVLVNRKDLLSSIERSTLLVKEGDKKPVIIGIEDERMELKINSTIGSMTEELSIEKEGDDLLIGFNPRFMIDALRAVDDEMVSMYFMTSRSPCIIRDDKGKYIYLILPINFKTVQ